MKNTQKNYKVLHIYEFFIALIEITLKKVYII